MGLNLPISPPESPFTEEFPEDARQIRIMIKTFDDRWLTLAGLLGSDRMGEAIGVHGIP